MGLSFLPQIPFHSAKFYPFHPAAASKKPHERLSFQPEKRPCNSSHLTSTLAFFWSPSLQAFGRSKLQQSDLLPTTSKGRNGSKRGRRGRIEGRYRRIKWMGRDAWATQRRAKDWWRLLETSLNRESGWCQMLRGRQRETLSLALHAGAVW